MLVYWILVYILLTSTTQASIIPGCRYRCNCVGSDCYRLGLCDGPCKPTYFGTRCQYVDIVQLNADPSVPLYLRDGNDSTCNRQLVTEWVEIRLNKTISFTWFRVVVNYPDVLLNFTTTLNEGIECRSERKFKVNNKTVDVTCEMRTMLYSIQLHGRVAPYVCSIYINLGRNLALRETTQQSSTYLNPTKYGSQNAVDGNTNQYMDSESCTGTNPTTAGSWWGVNFTWPIILNFIRVFNRNDERKYRLNEFILKTYSKHDAEIQTFVGGINIIVQDFIVTSDIPVSYIVIRQSRNLDSDDRALSLCEVEAYADYKCPDLKYGLFCSSECKCNIQEDCNPVTGLCSRGCLDGFYGRQCLFSCNKNCQKNICDFLNGNCYSACIPGYYGHNCSNECRVGLYGPSCGTSCSKGCKDNICHHITGHCICKPRFQGSNCEECIPGHYGEECNLICPADCNKTCHHLTGYCPCQPGYIGPRCQECPISTYGSDCESVCSLGCSYICNHITGNCLCKPGFVGSRCEECAKGMFGVLCNMTCPYGCENNTCDAASRRCRSCKTGFIGDICEECEYGFHGQRCDQTCPRICENKICDSRTGQCKQCKVGLSLDMCKDCPDNFYGILCTKMCSVNCANSTCDRETGKCEACLNQFIGDECNECPEKTYGEGCSLKCSSNCLNEKCEKDSGRCSQCASGYIGDNCEASSGLSPYWLLFGLCLVGVVALVILTTKRTILQAEEV